MVSDRRGTASWIAAVATALALSSGATAQQSALASFYVERNHFSDASGTGYFEYLDAMPQDGGVRVRLIRVSSSPGECGGSVVEAVERVVPNATAASLAQQDLCRLTQKQVDAAARSAKIPGLVIFASEADTIVATCGAREHVVELPVRAAIDSTIDRRDRAVGSALRLFDRVWDAVFTSNARLTESTGTALVPYLRSGRFAAVLSPQAFADYTGPPRATPAEAPELLERGTLPLEVYRPATYPPIAVSARVSGDVRLRLRVNPAGEVTDVHVLKSIPLLDDEAVKAARSWKFRPQSLSAVDVDVTLRFPKRCGS